MNTAYLVEERLLYPGKILTEKQILQIIEDDAKQITEEGLPLSLLKVVVFIRDDRREVHDFSRDEAIASEMLLVAQEVCAQLKDSTKPSII